MKECCFFISAGKESILCNYILNNKEKILNDFDVFIIFYDEDESYFEKLKTISKKAEKNKGTKFSLLKKHYHAFKILDYKYVFVFDDDCKLINGEFVDLYHLIKKYNLSLISPSHDGGGKISHPIMVCKKGNHILRYTNFIEMNFPVFETQSLEKFLQVYNFEVLGFGIDWWYLNILESNKNLNCAIYDGVKVYNPKNTDKSNCKIDQNYSRNFLTDQWIKLQAEKNILTWNHENLKFLY